MFIYVHTIRMNENVYVKLGQNIKKYRKETGLTQQKLADKVDMGINFIGKIEVGFSKPSLDTVIKIAKTLNVKLSDLFNFD